MRARLSSTLNAAYTALVEAFSGASQDHISIADALSTQVVDVLRNVEQRGAEAKKKVGVEWDSPNTDILIAFRKCNSSRNS